MLRVAVVLLALAGLAAPAQALTIRDVIELSRAGLGEDVLLALIEVDRGVYAIDNETLKTLKQAGVSERVIVALVRSGRELPVYQPEPAVPVADPPAPQPQVVVIDHHHPQPAAQVAVPVPVFVPVVATGGRVHRGDRRIRAVVPGTTYDTFVPFQSGPQVARPVVHEPKEPVYWGFGGKLRPDAWGQKREADRPEGKGGDGKGRDKDR